MSKGSRKLDAAAKPGRAVAPVISNLKFGISSYSLSFLFCILLALATLAVYAPVARNGFVDYDDADYVTANPHVQGGLTRENVAWAFVTGHANNWHPLTWLSHELDCQVFGQRPGAHHLINVLLHIVNSLLLFFVLRRATGAFWRSALVAAIFALHPLHVESVAWVSERKDVLSGFFFLLTLWAYVRYAETRVAGCKLQVASSELAAAATPNLQPWPWYALSLLFFTLGLLSKPMLVTTPFILLLLDYWPLKRVSSQWSAVSSSKSGASRLDQKPRTTDYGLLTNRSLLLEKLPFFILSAASSVITFCVQRRGGSVSSLTTLSLGARAANAVVAYTRYLGKTCWPVNLSVLYPHPFHWPIWLVAASAALLALIFAFVLAQAGRRPFLAVGWLWFFGGLTPVIGLVQVGTQSMADRYMYLPLIGLAIAVVWGVERPKAEGRRPNGIGPESREGARKTSEISTGDPISAFGFRPSAFDLRPSTPFVALSATALFAFAWLTSRQVRLWRDSETLFRHAVEVTPSNYLAYNNLGFYLWKHDRTAEAMQDYQHSLDINPSYDDALNNYGFALAGQKRYREALGYYESALKINPRNVEVQNNLGNALSELGQLDAAIAHYQVALRLDPDHTDAHNNLGIALAMQGKLDEAMSHFHQAIRAKPNYASAHSNYGNALAAQRKFEEAAAEYREALRLEPDDARTQNNLGNVLVEQGRLDEAIAHYTRALELNADNPEAHFNLGMALLRHGDRQSALPHFSAALRLKPDYAEARKQLEAIQASP